jgi:hypothetical protein
MLQSGTEGIDCPNRVRLIAEAIKSAETGREQSTEEKNIRGLPRRIMKRELSRREITLSQLTEATTKLVEIDKLKEARGYIAHIYNATDEMQRGISLKRLQEIPSQVETLRTIQDHDDA